MAEERRAAPHRERRRRRGRGRGRDRRHREHESDGADVTRRDRSRSRVCSRPMGRAEGDDLTEEKPTNAPREHSVTVSPAPSGVTGPRSGPTVRRSKSKISVPDNWGDVPKIGARVASSRFVAMRVPLDEKFSRMIRSPSELWTPEMFLEAQASAGHDVRLLIDLTNTTKYYDGNAVFRDAGVQYVKLCIEGFKAPPRETEVAAFLRIVDEFVASEPHGSIAVHCTHGLNRTGYLVVSYLVERGGMSVQEALKAFSDARPPGLIKHMYVEDLYRRFAPDAAVKLPELPAWATAKYAARRRR